MTCHQGYKSRQRETYTQFPGPRGPRLSLYDTSGYSSQTLATSLVFKEHGPATMPPRFKSSCVCADHPGMVGLGGLEPPASPLSGVRSNHLSYRPGSARRADRRQRTDNSGQKIICPLSSDVCRPPPQAACRRKGNEGGECLARSLTAKPDWLWPLF